MIIEAVVTRSVRLGALRAVPEKSQCGENCLDCRRARDEAALDGYRIHCQGEPSGDNAGRPIGRGLVEHQSIFRIGLVQKIAEGFALKRFQLGIDRRFVGVHKFTGFPTPTSTRASLKRPRGTAARHRILYHAVTLCASPQEHRRPSPAPLPRCVPDDSRHGSSPHKVCRCFRSPKDAQRTIHSW